MSGRMVQAALPSTSFSAAKFSVSPYLLPSPSANASTNWELEQDLVVHDRGPFHTYVEEVEMWLDLKAPADSSPMRALTVSFFVPRGDALPVMTDLDESTDFVVLAVAGVDSPREMSCFFLTVNGRCVSLSTI